MGDQLIVEAATYTAHNTLKRERETSLPPAGSEPAISASELPPIYALDRAAKEIGNLEYIKKIYKRTIGVNSLQRGQSEKTAAGHSMRKLQEHTTSLHSHTQIFTYIVYYLTLR